MNELNDKLSLLFDIGNTCIKWAYTSKHKGIHLAASIDSIDADLATLQALFSDLPVPDSIWISNVGSEDVLKNVFGCLDSLFGLSPNIIRVTEASCSITNKYQSRATLGVDRWVAAIGSRQVVAQGHLIIIDAGTAVTIDWLSEDDDFIGGSILPGFNLMHNALVKNTAGIKSEFYGAHKIIGTTTQECVNSGVSNGLIGAIEYIVKQMQQDIGMPTTIILTGGSAAAIKVVSSLDMILQQDLVLLGVAAIAKEPI